jgi:hypothetical protein
MKTKRLIWACYIILCLQLSLSPKIVVAHETDTIVSGLNGTLPPDTDPADFEIYRIQRLNGPVTIDGKVDEPAWKKIDPLPLVTHWPVFGNEVETGTEIRLAYDDEYLYVSGIIYVDPEKINAPTYKRDAIGGHIDNVSIILDTFRDNENALWFWVSPTGARTDAVISNDGAGENSISTYWDAIWEAETEITDTGWTVEMRIPFSSLRYENNNDIVEMGLIAFRYHAYDVNLEIFPAIPTDWGTFSFLKPSQSQPVVLENIRDQRPFYVIPYLLGGMDRAVVPDLPEGEFNHQSGMNYDAGFDLKMGLTNNTTLDLTVNTDFAQVEADDQQINLTRFSLFFPERRQFFLERASVFSFSFGELDRLFYSRRIGLSEGRPVRILGGSRMISRTGGWDIGLLSMQTASAFEQPSENNSVLRLRRQILNPQSYVGGMVTSRIGMDGSYNVAYGIDGIFRLYGEDFLNFNIAQTADSEMSNPLLSSNSLRLQSGLERRSFSGISYNLTYNYSGIDYNPAMGFQLRQNYMRFGERISYGWQPGDESPFQRIRLSMIGSVFISNLTGELETAEVGPAFLADFKRGDGIILSGTIITENLPAPFSLAPAVAVPQGSYRYPSAMATYRTPEGRSLRTIITAGGGGFFDGTRFTLGLLPNWSISRVVNLQLFYQYNRIEFRERVQQLNAHIARFRAEFTFNTRVTFSSFVQYNSTNNLAVINARFRYNPRDGNNFYLVFNEILSSDRTIAYPVTPFSMNRTVLMKYTHTLAF